jgi:hypothetical protein
MRRLLIITYVVFCFELGVLLFIFPWVSLWTKNYFVDHYPLVSGITHNYFLRGAVSGVGLADVWLACYELWRSRRDWGLANSRPKR